MILTKEKLLSKKTNVKKVEIEGLGEVMIKPLSGDDIKKFQAVKEATDLMIITAALGLCDKDGETMISDDDIGAFSENMEFQHLKAISEHVMKLSGIIDPK